MTTSRAAVPAPTVDDLEALRGPLTGYCYRMLGSAADTDDAVQDTVIRAYSALDRYDPDRTALSTWVHRIATNICLDHLRVARRRGTSMELGPARTEPGDIGEPLPADRFVEPMPDSRLITATDPAEIVAQRATVRLAFVTALQVLAPRQRAVLVLRDVLAFSAEETADVLDTSVAAVNSALQRARARLDAARSVTTDPLLPDDAEQRQLLNSYVAAFEAHDIPALRKLLRDDATTSMPPFAWWLDGADVIAAVMATGDACIDDRLLPVAINGAPGFGQYRLEDGVHHPFALLLIETSGDKVAELTTFLGTADRFPEFGLPTKL